MKKFEPIQSISWLRAVTLGGLASGVLDAAESAGAFYLAFGMNPIQVLQFIASGAMGKAAFEGGLGTALLGTVFHFIIAFVAAAVFALAAVRVPALRKHWIPAGLAYGAWVWFFMNFIVVPQTAVQQSAPSLGLILNGLIGHALFVGLPIAYFARAIATGYPSETGKGAASA